MAIHGKARRVGLRDISGKLLATIFATLLLCGTLPMQAQASDAWLATRTCLTNERCKSTSSTYGAPGSDEYTVHEHDSARSTRWPLTSAPTTRVFQSQTGTVEVFIYTTGILRSQSATCVCIQLPCATKV